MGNSTCFFFLLLISFTQSALFVRKHERDGLWIRMGRVCIKRDVGVKTSRFKTKRSSLTLRQLCTSETLWRQVCHASWGLRPGCFASLWDYNSGLFYFVSDGKTIRHKRRCSVSSHPSTHPLELHTDDLVYVTLVCQARGEYLSGMWRTNAVPMCLCMCITLCGSMYFQNRDHNQHLSYLIYLLWQGGPLSPFSSDIKHKKI